MSDELSVFIVRELKALDAASHGRPFASLLVVKKLASKTASNGNSFFSLELGDRTGSFTCTVFNDSPVFEALKAAGEGAVVRIEEAGRKHAGSAGFGVELGQKIPQENLQNHTIGSDFTGRAS